MKKLIPIIFFVINALITFGQEYTINYSGNNTGIVTINKDPMGKIAVALNISEMNVYKLDAISFMAIDNVICPLIPEKFIIFLDTKQISTVTIEENTMIMNYIDGSWSKTVINENIEERTHSNGYWHRKVIDGNIVTSTYDGGWVKTVNNGNIEETTYSNGRWTKKIIDENTTTITHSDDFMGITVISGNTETTTYSDGSWNRRTIEGDIETYITSDGWWYKVVVEGNVTMYTNYDGSWKRTVVDREGYNISIFEEGIVNPRNAIRE